MDNRNKRKNTVKEIYEKPRVTHSGYYPEPVETGCCLLSCGALRIGSGCILETKEKNLEHNKIREALDKILL